ncbi:HEAT repeat protein [Desulfohalotomaculum tongense]|uniref:DVU0298 family protein n=1 Tax=Desulforadius tongensis TaxID=1216062 RepID=UPI00195E2FFF|nr:DVU0298 family protein [Desulforadius tongensis]MBM7853969.1 HEAT repeat protein [Desulforadius tongensis]
MKKQEIAQLVTDKKYETLLQLAETDAKKLIRYLVRLTYSQDDLLRWRAIEALGLAAGKIAKTEPEVIRDIIRRFLWSMNDESGAQSWSAPQAIAEIIYNEPGLYADLGPVMISASMDERIFQPGMLWAVGRLVGKVDYINEIVPDIIAFLDNPNAVIRGYAAWALGEIGVSSSVDRLKNLVNDKARVKIYINGELYEKTVGDIAQGSIEKLS